MNKLKLSDIFYIFKINALSPKLSFRPFVTLYFANKNKNLLYIKNGKKLLAWMEKYHIYNDYYGISSLYVDKSARGKSLAKLMIEDACKKIDGKILTATSSKGLIKYLEDMGFKKLESSKNIPTNIFLYFIFKRYWHPFSWLKLIFIKVYNDTKLVYLIRE